MRLCLFVRQRRCFVLCRLPPAGLSILHRLRGCIWPMQGCCTGRRAGTQLFRKTAFLHLAFRGLPSPGPRGYFALGGKVTKTPPETPRTPFSLIGRLQGRNPVATEFPRGLRPPRNRCGGYPTSAVAPRAGGWEHPLFKQTFIASLETGQFAVQEKPDLKGGLLLKRITGV